jgi:N-acetylglutamate synthase-like GNAT family acetyltransferase
VRRDEAANTSVVRALYGADDATVSSLTDLINKAYASSEEGLWIDGATRTTEEEVTGLVRAGQFAVARRDGHLAGCVRIRRLDETASEFGMLAADHRLRGTGVGRDLVRYAERHGHAVGSRVMRLELLVPREGSHPSKEFLARWYARIGYRPVRRGTIEESHPDLAPLVATPCDVVTYQKDL